jgi:translocator protein
MTLKEILGLATWLVWRRAGFAGAGLALSLCLVQLALNALWTGLFFGLQRPGLAFVELVLLWATIVTVDALFWRLHATAGALMVLMWPGSVSRGI